jgi:vacuolar iron transporter family protein
MAIIEYTQADSLHTVEDPHRRGSALADIILGGQDGLVNVLGIALGVAAATGDSRIVLTACLAATFAESVSMGAVAFTSTLAQADHYESEREREHRHILQAPDVEREEIRSIFASKGYQGQVLDGIVDAVTANYDVWVVVMLAEEHRLSPTNRGEARRSALVVGLSAIAGSLIPLVPFLFLSIGAAMWLAIVITALVLFAVGSYKASVTVGRPTRSGLEMALIGTLSALVGYLVGMLLKAPVGL